MRGQQQSTTRRLNRHYQSGGGEGWYWWDYEITFTGSTRHSSPVITTTPLSKMLKNHRYLKCRITSSEARDGNGNIITVPDFYLVSNLLPVATVGYYSTAHIPSALNLFKGQDFIASETIINPVTGYTETGIKIPSTGYFDFDIDLNNFGYTQQDFEIKRMGHPDFFGDYTPDQSFDYCKIIGKMGMRFNR